MGYGVIGSPTGSGPVSLGSSPGTPAVRTGHAVRYLSPRAARRARCRSAPFVTRAPLCSGLARRPLKAVARVRIPSGLPVRNKAQVFATWALFIFAGVSAPSPRSLCRHDGTKAEDHGAQAALRRQPADPQG